MKTIEYPNEMVGDLYFLYNGQELTPHNLYFLAGFRDPSETGLATTHFDNALRPVYLCRNRAQLSRPDYAGLTAYFRSGFITDLHE